MILEVTILMINKRSFGHPVERTVDFLLNSGWREHCVKHVHDNKLPIYTMSEKFKQQQRPHPFAEGLKKKSSSDLTKTILQGTVKGGRRQSRQRKR